MDDKMRIIVTDSGVGGLVFTAELAKRLKANAYFAELELIFINCRPSETQGFQDLASDEERSQIFSQALFAMQDKYSPDLIIIACNSLSAIYKDTCFAQKTKIPVKGIIEAGTQGVSDLLTDNEELNIIMFATTSTVNFGIHKQQLMEFDFASERLSYQACHALPQLISCGDKIEIEKSVNHFVDKAFKQVGEKAFALALFCTHFTYARDVFEQATRRYPNFSGQIIDPNLALVDLVLNNYQEKCFEGTDLTVKVISQVKISEQTKNFISSFLSQISLETVQALVSYENLILVK